MRWNFFPLQSQFSKQNALFLALNPKAQCFDGVPKIFVVLLLYLYMWGVYFSPCINHIVYNVQTGHELNSSLSLWSSFRMNKSSFIFVCVGLCVPLCAYVIIQSCRHKQAVKHKIK